MYHVYRQNLHGMGEQHNRVPIPTLEMAKEYVDLAKAAERVRIKKAGRSWPCAVYYVVVEDTSTGQRRAV